MHHLLHSLCAFLLRLEKSRKSGKIEPADILIEIIIKKGYRKKNIIAKDKNFVTKSKIEKKIHYFSDKIIALKLLLFSRYEIQSIF